MTEEYARHNGHADIIRERIDGATRRLACSSAAFLRTPLRTRSVDFGIGGRSLSNSPGLPADPELPASLESTPPDTILVDAELDSRLLEGVDWSGRDARGMRLSDSELRSASLDEATIERAHLRDVAVLDGSWANATGTDMSFIRVRFEQVRLTGATLAASQLENVTFVDCRLDLCSFRFSQLEIVRFEGCRMNESDFYEAQLTSVMFDDCDLTGVTLTGATFADSEIRGCDLSAAKSPDRLRGVRMPWADVMRIAGELASGIGIEVLDE
jgi:uncharacterized protein YjbI with pentapeptide repeats